MNADKRRWIWLLVVAGSFLIVENVRAEQTIGEVEIDERSFENYRLSRTYRDRVNSEYKERIIKWQFPLSDSLFGYSYPMGAGGNYTLQRSRSRPADRLIHWTFPISYEWEQEWENKARILKWPAIALRQPKWPLLAN